VPPPAPRSRTGPFLPHMPCRAVRSTWPRAPVAGSLRSGPGRFPRTPRARARMPRSAVTGCHTPAAPGPPRTPLLRLALRGLDTPPAMKTAVCSGGCQRRLSPAAPQGPAHSLRVPGGASCGGPSGGSRPRTPAWPPASAPSAGLPPGLSLERLRPAASHHARGLRASPLACASQPCVAPSAEPLTSACPAGRPGRAPSRRQRRRSSGRSPARPPHRHHGGRRVASHPRGAGLLVGCRRARRPFLKTEWVRSTRTLILRCTHRPPQAAKSTSAMTRTPKRPTRSRSRRVHAHAIPGPAPACRAALRADTRERPRGRP